MDFPLSLLWSEKFYPELETRLGYSRRADVEARDELSRLLRKRKSSPIDWRSLEQSIKGRTALVLGAGPSLAKDMKLLYSAIRKSTFVLVAADGAIDALCDKMIFPEICMSDLDSASEESLIDQSEKRELVVHAHGDNLSMIRALVPKLGNMIIGTTQVEATEFVHNVGGLTDGDRACYFTARFGPKEIVLAGMDFAGPEGEYSVSRTASAKRSERERMTKLEIGLRSLEFLISNCPQIKFVNATSAGAEIRGVRRLKGEDIIRELS